MIRIFKNDLQNSSYFRRDDDVLRDIEISSTSTLEDFVQLFNHLVFLETKWPLFMSLMKIGHRILLESLETESIKR